jgi:hypothetical protein
MGFVPEGDKVLWKKWKRQKQLDRLPFHVRNAMTPEEIHAFLYQDVPGINRRDWAFEFCVIEARLKQRAGSGPPPPLPRKASWLRRLVGRS